MKVRLISLVLLLCIAVTPVLSAIPAQAAPTVPTITVSVKAPVNWTEVYLYLADSNSEYNFGSLADGHPYTPDTINFLTCGGRSRYYSYTVDHDCNLRITADLSPLGHGANPILKIEETYDDPDSPAGIPAVDYVSVFAKVPEDWTDVRIWAWDEEEIINRDPWPGTMMMTHISNGWHTARLPGWFTSVLIVGNGGSIYTQEIIVEPGRDIWIDAYIDYQNPIFTYDRLDIPCSHKNHTPSGLCVLCRVNVPHDYDINFHCSCGADATDFTTVYFEKTDEFSDVYALWSNSSPSSGILETGIQMVVDENGIYSCQFPKGMNYLVFHDSDGTRCVANPGDMTEENVVFRGSDKSWVTYEEAITLKETEQLENNHPLTVILIFAGILTLLVAGITTVILIKKKRR